MDNQKIVVILLLITIILSVVSVIVTLSVDTTSASQKEGIVIDHDDSSGKISFEIVNPPTGGAG